MKHSYFLMIRKGFFYHYEYFSKFQHHFHFFQFFNHFYFHSFIDNIKTNSNLYIKIIVEQVSSKFYQLTHSILSDTSYCK